MALVAAYLLSEKSTILSGFRDDVKITGETTEVNIGVRKYLLENHVRFFIEGGMALISATVRIEAPGISASGSDSTTGFWYGTGADIMLGDLLS